MEQFLQDVRYAARQLVKRSGFALVTVLTLALGIGANSAIFSVVEGVLLRPLPYRHGDRLVHIGSRPSADASDVRFSVMELADYRRQSNAFAGIAEYHSMSFPLLGEGDPDQVKTGVVSANFFTELGVRPLLGRLFVPEDDRAGAPHVMVLGHDYWESRFGKDPGIVGKTLRMNREAITVVGVLPPLPAYPGNDDAFVPTTCCPFRSSTRAITRRESRLLQLFGRLKPGASLAAATSDVDTISRRLHAEFPASFRKSAAVEVPVTSVHEELVRRFRPTLLVLLGTVILVLLIACANVANLALARLLSRDREIVVRTALGASRKRLLRQFFTESTLLSLLGGVLGLVFAFATLRFLKMFALLFTPRASEIALDLPVLLFTLLISLATGFVFGIVPALQATRRNIVTSLKEGSGTATLSTSAQRMQSLLIVVQVALSFVLLIGAGLTLRTVIELHRVDLGFKPENIVTLGITLPPAKYPKPQDGRRLFLQLLERIVAHPIVLAAAIGTDGPLGGGLMNPTFKIENRQFPPDQDPTASFHGVSPSYFRTLGIPLLRGRMFTEEDREKAPGAVIISQVLARQYWPDEDPLGRRIAMTSMGRDDDWWTIVGVVGDVKQHGLEADAGASFYYPFRQAPGGFQEELFVRTAGSPERIVGDVRAELRRLDPEQPISSIQTLEQLRSDLIAPHRLTASLLALFAILAFVITATGVSAEMAFYVNQRTQEIGVRSALGAQPRDVLRLVMREGMKLVLIGLVSGVIGALFLSRLIASVLFGTPLTDPVTFLSALLVLSVAVAVACLVPARRAAKLDPMIALRRL
jgi:putative ABC transport system permease protein